MPIVIVCLLAWGGLVCCDTEGALVTEGQTCLRGYVIAWPVLYSVHGEHAVAYVLICVK